MPELINVWDEVRKPFHPNQVSRRETFKGSKVFLDYVDIPSTINRLLDVFKEDWEWVITKSECNLLRDTDKGPEFLGVVEGYLSLADVKRHGVGAGINRDPDTAIKTADAEALKKASNKFGVALELWDETARDAVAAYRSNDLASLKAQVAARVKTMGHPVTKESIAKLYDISIDSLNDPTVLKEILWGKPTP